ncbi:ABC transporter transmembrane domain-containing protein [Streptomyces zhihengii]
MTTVSGIPDASDAPGAGGPPTAEDTPAGEGRELLPVATAARTRAALRDLVRPDRARAAAGLGVLVAATAVGLLVQPLLGRVVDIVADGRPAAALTLPVVLLLLVAVAQGATTTYGLTQVARLGETVLARLREQFVERALHLPADRLERAGAGDLTARVTGDVARVAEAVRSALPEMARSVLTIVLTLVAMALLDVRFLLAALLAVPVQLLTARWYVRRALTLYADQRVANGAQQQQLLETIGGAATVRGHRLEDEHTERSAARSRTAVGLTMRSVNLVLGFYGRLHVAEYIGLAAVLVTGYLLVGDGAVSVGTATAAALYFHSLFGPVNAALVLLDDAQSAAACLARLVGVTDLGRAAGDGAAPGGCSAPADGSAPGEGSAPGDGPAPPPSPRSAPAPDPRRRPLPGPRPGPRPLPVPNPRPGPWPSPWTPSATRTARAAPCCTTSPSPSPPGSTWPWSAPAAPGSPHSPGSSRACSGPPRAPSPPAPRAPPPSRW